MTKEELLDQVNFFITPSKKSQILNAMQEYADLKLAEKDELIKNLEAEIVVLKEESAKWMSIAYGDGTRLDLLAEKYHELKKLADEMAEELDDFQSELNQFAPTQPFESLTKYREFNNSKKNSII